MGLEWDLEESEKDVKFFIINPDQLGFMKIK